MKIDRIIAGIRGENVTAKQASETPATPPAAETAPTAPALITALHAALQTSEKSAADTSATKSPVDDVMKVAQELAAAEKEAALKEAQILGAAFADAAIARLNEWNKTAAEMLVAPPSAQGTDNFGKFAQENPALIQQAAKLGYDQAKAEMEKQAEESYVQGYNDTVATIHKTAALEFLKAAAVTAEIIKASTASN